MEKEFAWTSFYVEFADAILPYSKDRQGLIRSLKNCFDLAGLRFPKMDYDGKVRDVDPFTVFGLFNKGITSANRIKLLTAIKGEFDIKASVPELFNGIPVLNNMMACYFAYSNDPRYGKNDISNLWQMFELAIKVADGEKELYPAFIGCWDRVIKQFGVAWNLTMGLYWVRPWFFVNLDSINRDCMRRNASLTTELNRVAPRVLNGKLPTGAQYVAICESMAKAVENHQLGCNSLPEFSYQAWKDGQSPDGVSGALADGRKVWLCAPGEGGRAWPECKENGYMCLGWDDLGDLSKYADRMEIHQKLVSMRDEDARSPKNASLACWQFANEIKPNDIIVVKTGLHKLLGVGIVSGAYFRDDGREAYKNLIPCRWIAAIDKTFEDQLPMKTLTDISAYPDLLHSIFMSFGLDPETLVMINPDDGVTDSTEEADEEYSKRQFLAEVFMTDDQYERIKRLLLAKKNIVLQGAPGVGKTFSATRFVDSILGVRNSSHRKMVQFHQNYTYEDFIGGYKPSSDGFEYRPGIFAEFCSQASKDSQSKYFFIIDEINRGNLSKIFGELLMLIEADKRSEVLNLAYTHEQFFVPDNVYIIGMMNTADRSLAMIDYALRRRFSFVTLNPAFKSEGFARVLAAHPDRKMSSLVRCVEALNDAIRTDPGLGAGFEIGHSYFCNDGMSAGDIVEYELAPILQEYWFEDSNRANDWIRKLQESIA